MQNVPKMCKKSQKVAKIPNCTKQNQKVANQSENVRKVTKSCKTCNKLKKMICFWKIQNLQTNTENMLKVWFFQRKLKKLKNVQEVRKSCIKFEKECVNSQNSFNRRLYGCCGSFAKSSEYNHCVSLHPLCGRYYVSTHPKIPISLSNTQHWTGNLGMRWYIVPTTEWM